jgi:paired amphipathic helix protein Sin3a
LRFQESKYSLFFVSNNWYLFLRLHQLLCERLFKMSELGQKIAADEAKCKRERTESTAAALRLKASLEVEPEDYYPYFLERIKELLDGQVEASVYEDILREMYGIHAYTAFTMDKIVQSLVRTVS